jgi:predicted PurR-regulated permease PerM
MQQRIVGVFSGTIILGIFIITQLIDNYLFQPIIYSNSVKAHPLEIFLVILIAGQIGGVVGIIAAIPLYTIIRVILVEFYPEKKFVKRLIGGLDQNKIG